MTGRRLTVTEHFEQLKQQRGELAAHREMLRLWLKPRIKRIAGTWVCESRGVKSCGSSPKQAYASWVFWVEMNQGLPC